MSVFDVTKDTIQKIDEIQWNDNSQWNLVIRQSHIHFKGLSIGEMTWPLVSTKVEAEDLIKALQKAIELGWVK